MGMVEQDSNTIKQIKQKKNNTIIIPLSDWTILYFASILANSAFSSICAVKSSCPLTPGCSNTPICVSVHVHSSFH